MSPGRPMRSLTPAVQESSDNTQGAESPPGSDPQGPSENTAAYPECLYAQVSKPRGRQVHSDTEENSAGHPDPTDEESSSPAYGNWLRQSQDSLYDILLMENVIYLPYGEEE